MSGMSAQPPSGEPDRLGSLADRALVGNTPDEAVGLRAEENRAAVEDLQELEMAAAAATIGMLRPESYEPLPRDVRDRIEEQARLHLSAAAATGDRGSGARAGAGGVIARIGRSGWLAAAACLAIAAAAWWPKGPIDHIAARASLMGAFKDHLHWPWKPGNHPAGSSVQGDIVWSTSAQRGYIRFIGLPVNDPAKEQYQLWIHDASQHEDTPVDGGVFDHPGPQVIEVVLPITHKLRITGPVTFIVTIEKPGGVVVSDRSRVLVIAHAQGP